MTTPCETCTTVHARHRPRGTRRILPRLRIMAALHRQRRALGRLDDDRLDDLGISRDDARAEAARPIWDVPAHWRR